MKKVAIPIENGSLSHHFGHSRTFQFFEIENKQIVKSYTQDPPPHEEGVIPRWLVSEQVTDLLVGGIGPKAIEILYAKGMNVYIGVEVATPDQLVADFIAGELKSGKNYCHH
jgi:predicted Fe-Mo cluster-binding NifX family protein